MEDRLHWKLDYFMHLCLCVENHIDICVCLVVVASVGDWHAGNCCINYVCEAQNSYIGSQLAIQFSL